jgi:eukaryotic-like serine/threonine-protein kinase
MMLLRRLNLVRPRILDGGRHKQGESAAYNDSLILWKDTDPDVPILKQAKAEYSKLQ